MLANKKDDTSTTEASTGNEDTGSTLVEEVTSPTGPPKAKAAKFWKMAAVLKQAAGKEDTGSALVEEVTSPTGPPKAKAAKFWKMAAVLKQAAFR